MKDFSEITTAWIEARMKEIGLKRKDLMNDLGFDASYISLIFADETNPRKINLSKPMKALFYYYFRFKETEK